MSGENFIQCIEDYIHCVDEHNLRDLDKDR